MHQDTARTPSAGQWLKLVAVYLLIPLFLFLAGGEVDWWQAWIYAALVLVIGIGGRVWAERRHPGLMADRQSVENAKNAKSWDKFLAPMMAISIGYPLAVVAGLDHRYDWSPEFPIWLVAIGFMLVSSGYAFAAWAMAENKFFYSVVCVRRDQGHVVCDSGPYRYVRHPGYAGSVLALFGIALALGSVWTVIPALVASTITVVRTALEDRTLKDELPGYCHYAQRVRYRLIPFVY